MHPAEDSTYLIKLPSSINHEKPGFVFVLDGGEESPMVPADWRGNHMLDPFDSLPCIIMIAADESPLLAVSAFFVTTSIHQFARMSGDRPHSIKDVPAVVSCCVLPPSSPGGGSNLTEDGGDVAAIVANALYRSFSSDSVRVDSSGIVCLSCLQKVAIVAEVEADVTVAVVVVLLLPRTVKSGTQSCKIQSSMSSHVGTVSVSQLSFTASWSMPPKSRVGEGESETEGKDECCDEYFENENAQDDVFVFDESSKLEYTTPNRMVAITVETDFIRIR